MNTDVKYLKLHIRTLLEEISELLEDFDKALTEVGTYATKIHDNIEVIDDLLSTLE